MHRRLQSAIAGCLMLSALSATGCATQYGPTIWPHTTGYVIPVSPFFQDMMEDKFWMEERYERAPVLGPIGADGVAIALDEPSDDEVMRAMPSIEGGIPLLHTVQRDNVSIVKELLDDSIDPPRVYPLIGPAQLHHSKWKCTVYYTETTHVGWPLPYTTVDQDAVEVVYIDRSHLHQVGNVETDSPISNY